MHEDYEQLVPHTDLFGPVSGAPYYCGRSEEKNPPPTSAFARRITPAMSQQQDATPEEMERARKAVGAPIGDAMHMQTAEDNPWLFTAEEVKETPSRVQDLPEHVEARILVKTAVFLQDCGKALNLPQLTVSVAIKFFQRFFMLESMLAHPPPLVAAACLFLSCKVQETHKRLRDVIQWTVKIRTRNTPDFPDGMDMFENSPGYYDEKNSILDKEREVLRVLNFDLTVDHPYKHLWILTNSFLSGMDPLDKKSVAQASWNFLNDSFRTYVHMRYDPREIATAAFFLSCKLHEIPLPDGTTKDPVSRKRLLAWHELFNVDLHHIEEICTSLLDMYEMDNNPGNLFSNGPGVIESLPPSHPASKRRKVAAA